MINEKDSGTESKAEKKYKNWRIKYSSYIKIMEENQFTETRIGENKKLFVFQYKYKKIIEYDIYIILYDNSCILTIHSNYEEKIKSFPYFCEFIFIGTFHSGLKGFRNDQSEKEKYEIRREFYDENYSPKSISAHKHHVKNIGTYKRPLNINNHDKVGLEFHIQNQNELKIIIENILNALDPNYYQIYEERLEQEQLSNFDRISELEFKENNPDLQDEIGDYQKEDVKVSRIGQGKFRKLLEKLWDNCCAVTSVKCDDILIASHIKSWSDCMKDGLDSTSENKGRFRDAIDPNNGLLLTANLDKLFDKGLISFSDDGNIIIHDKFLSKNYSEHDLKIIFGVNHVDDIYTLKLRKPLKDEQKYFLQYHRKKYNFQH